jgi:predicted O-methyltransferase YrrM
MGHCLAGTFRPRQAREDLAAVYRALKHEAAGLERTSLAEIYPGIEETTVQVKYSPRMGGGTLADLITLAQVVRYGRFTSMFEIGTFRGYTTYHLALNSQPDAHVYTLDLPAAGIPAAALELTDLQFIDKPISGEWYRNTDCEYKITQLFGDSASFDWTAYQGKMDFVYVDGGHSYEYAMADSLTARKLLGPGGVILWHDYPTYPGVWACLDRVSQEWPGKIWWIDGTALALWKAA